MVTEGIPTKMKSLGNTDSDTTLSLTPIYVRKENIFTGEQQTEKDTENTGATVKIVPNVPEEASVSVRKQKEGWWYAMYGRMLWNRLTGLRKHITANGFTPGEKKRLNDPLQKPKNTMACVLLACSASRICASSAS